MRTEKEIYDLVLNFAFQDERIRIVSPAIIRALEQMGHFSPQDLAFALVCHSCPQEPFHQYSLFEP